MANLTGPLARYLGQEVPVTGNATIQVKCKHCQRVARMRATGMHLTLRFIPPKTWDIATMDFFCIHCRELNTQVVSGELADRMERAGVGTIVLTIPRELLEHPASDVPVISGEDLEELRADLHGDDRWPAEWETP